MKNNLKETILTVCLVALALLFLNPLNFWMPDMMVVVMLSALLVIFGIFASFILKEEVFDERDNINRSLAGRNAFLAGSAILMFAILIQGYQHVVDPWLVVALIVMILAKIITRFWSDKNL